MEFLEDLFDNIVDWWEDTLFEIKAFFYRLTDKFSKPDIDVNTLTPDECWTEWERRGKGHSGSPKVNRLLLRKAADAGIPDAIDILAYQLYTGKGDENKNVEEAEKYAKQGAMAGHAGCMIQLGTIFKDKGQGREALRWFTQAADEGQCQAMFLAAQMLEKGEAGVERNRDEAITLYRKAAKMPGNTYAEDSIKALARMNVSAYEDGEYMDLALNAGVDGSKSAEDLYRWGGFWKMNPDPKHLAELLFAAQKDHPDACLELAGIFSGDKAKLYGIYSEELSAKYRDKAVELLETTAGHGDYNAVYKLYNLYKDSDPEKAQKYLLKGVDAGIPELQFKLGEVYWNQGRFQEALDLMGTAGEAGYLPAATRMRDIYMKGDGPIKKNVDIGNHWIIKVLEISRHTYKVNQNLHR